MKWTAVADCTVADGQVKFENIEADSIEEAFDIAYDLAKECPTAGDEIVNIYPTAENKQAICDKLLEALKMTRNLYDLVYLKYFSDNQTVNAHFGNGTVKTVNVAMDSGTAMIRDIIKAIV